MASPSRISARAGSLRASSTISGAAAGDVVARARVDAHVVALLVHLHARAVELPFDRGRRRRCVPSRRRCRRRAAPASARAAGTARSCSAPALRRLLRSRSRATAAMPPPAMAARRTIAGATSAAAATASIIRPSSAPCRSSPISRRARKSASRGVARAKSPIRSSALRLPDPAPLVVAICSSVASTSARAASAPRHARPAERRGSWRSRCLSSPAA